MSLFEWITLAREFKKDGAEGLELYNKFLKSTATPYLYKVKQTIKDAGFAMPMMCYSPDFTIPDKNKRRREVEQQKIVIEVTAYLGGTYCRVLSGQRYPEVNREDGIRWVVESLQNCLQTAQQYGVTLVMENHYKDGYWKYLEFAQKNDIFLEIINAIDSPFFGVQYDPSNAIISGDNPIQLLQNVKQRGKTMHASDRYLKNGTTLDDLRKSDGTLGYSVNLSHGIIGKGLNDYNAIFSILKEISFTGWVSIEDGINGMEEMKESVKFLRKMQKRYGE